MSCGDWLDMTQRNKPQSNAVGGGIVYMLASGLQIVWIFNKDLMKFPWTDEQPNFLVILTYIAFYIAAIAGLFVTSFIIDLLSKKIIYVSRAKNLIRFLIEHLTFLAFSPDACTTRFGRSYLDAE